MSTIDDRVGLEAFDARRDQLAHAADLIRRQRLAEVEVQRDRCRRSLILILEHAVLAEREVDARALDLRERGDRARELALERAAVVDLFGEARLAEVRVVEQLEALAGARQPGARGDRARLVELVGRDDDLAGL